MTVKLRKSGKTEIRLVEKPAEHVAKAGTMQATEEVEGELWEDLDGNVYAWTPKGSGVISTEIKDGEENVVEKHYKQLKGKKDKLSTEERITALEEALQAALKKIAELGG